MASNLLLPLNSQVEIVDGEGKPTAQFTRLLQKLAVGSNLSITNGVVNFAAMAAKTILANKTGSSASPTACTISDILDFVTGTPARGDILYRGATAWQRLPADVSGKVLQTNGPGTDPTWVTPSGGGGGASYEGFGNLLSLAGLTKLVGASANISLVDGTKAHTYSWTASGANSVQMAYTAAPATPWNIYIRFKAYEQYGVNTDFGLAVRNSTTGKITVFMLFFNGNRGIAVQEWTNATTFSSGPFTSANLDSTSPMWLRINNDGTNLNYYYSSNGIDWFLLLTRTLAAFMGSVDQVGIGGVPQIAGRAFVSNFGFTTPV